MSFVPTRLLEYVAVIRRNAGNTDGQPIGGLRWSGEWVEEPGLVPKGYTKRAYGLGEATFNLLPEQFYSEGILVQRNHIKSGSYIGIATKGTDGAVADPFWIGYISEMPSVRFKQSGTNTLGVVSALRIGNMLDQIPLNKWRVNKNDGSTTAIYDTTAAPLANYSSQSGEVIGNKILTQAIPLFAGDPEDCGTDSNKYWTRYDLLKHIENYSYPQDITGKITMNASIDALERLTVVVKETFDLTNATMKQALDIIISRQRGLLWDADIRGGNWFIDIYLTFEDTSKQEIDLSGINRDKVIELSVQDGDGIPYDKIVVEGNPVVWMGTIENGNADQTSAPKYFEKGWTDDQQDAYDAYLTAEGKAPIGPEYEDVYKRWIFRPNDNHATLKTQHASDGTGSAVLFCQRITYNISNDTFSINAADDTMPYMPTAKIERTLPWSAGFAEDGDTRGIEQQNQTTYLPPMMFNQVDDDDTVDISKTTVAGENIYIDDRGLGMRVKLSLEADNAYALTELAAQTPPPSYNWESNAWTIAIASSQVLRLESIRTTLVGETDTPLDSNQIRKTLTIQGDWHLWACHVGSIVGVDADGDAVRVVDSSGVGVLDNGKTFLLRNDYPAAKLALQEAELWAFRESVTGYVKLSDVGMAEMWPIGTSISTIKDADTYDTKVDESGETASGIHTINGIIESISCSLDINSPSVTISFGISDVPDIAGRSNSVQTTSPKKLTITDTTKRLTNIEKQMQGIPVHSSKGSASGSVSSAAPTESYGIVWGGNFGDTTYGRLQIRYRNHTQWSLKGFVPVTVVTDWTALDLPDDWTPADELTTQTPEGIGYVRLLPFANSIGGAQWEDTGFTGRTEEIDAVPTILSVKIIGGVRIYITWDQPVTILGGAPTLAASAGALVASSATTDYDNIISYALDRSVAATETVTITADAEWVRAAHDAAYKSASVSQSVDNINIRNAMVLVAHRIMPATLYRGQVVRLKDNGFSVIDSNGISRDVIDIMPSTDILPEHHHSSDYDGGYSVSHAWAGSSS